MHTDPYTRMNSTNKNVRSKNVRLLDINKKTNFEFKNIKIK